MLNFAEVPVEYSLQPLQSADELKVGISLVACCSMNILDFVSIVITVHKKVGKTKKGYLLISPFDLQTLSYGFDSCCEVEFLLLLLLFLILACIEFKLKLINY